MPVYAPGQTTGFNSVSDYLGANQGTLDREASDVNSLVGSELDAGKTAADQFAQGVTSQDYSASPGYSDAATKQNAGQNDAELTKSQGGLQDLLGRTSGGYGANTFDAMLLGAHGGFKDTQDKAQTLHGYLDATAAAKAPQPFQATPIDAGRPNGSGINGTPPAAPPSLAPTQSTPNKGPGDVYPGTMGAKSNVRRSPFTMGGF